MGELYSGLDLNQIVIDDETKEGQAQSDFSCNTEHIDVHFKNLAPKLIREIEQADAVVGCVAWLTHFDILDALARKHLVSIVVQKEDFLRPDYQAPSNWKRILQEKYRALKNPCERYMFPGIVSQLSTSSDPDLQAIRCVGVHNRTRAPAVPRSHHKFVVFCKIWDDPESAVVLREDFEQAEPSDE